ncbi:hypothetical protein M8C21_016963 [Ambrosia artemisiifolia]|uniref:Uncharacterized protein n=1 Tax=Ambrosia artemisiifolia TaxID=4212 RepID=A0AAD5D1R8_AMBAR|nr:hypothetical protein M8C21_016963 [Ambrosia artemisiifolia]
MMVFMIRSYADADDCFGLLIVSLSSSMLLSLSLSPLQTMLCVIQQC